MPKKAKTPPPLRLNREQLYTIAALSSSAYDRGIQIKSEQDDEDNTVVIAIPVRDNALPIYKDARHKNGFAYYRIDNEGHRHELKEGEL